MMMRNKQFTRVVFIVLTAAIAVSYGSFKTMRWFRRSNKYSHAMSHKRHPGEHPEDAKVAKTFGLPGSDDEATPPPKPIPTGGKVVSVIDGDTIVLDGGVKIRYIGIDTPERDQPLYNEATEANRAQVEGRDVQLEACAARPWDDYDRLLARVLVDGKDVADDILDQGLARVFEDRDCPGAPVLNGYWKAVRAAYAAGKGIWSKAPKTPVAADKAADADGRTVYVCGTVNNVHRGDLAVHLNFGADWKSDFTVTLSAPDWPSFADGPKLDETLAGRTVRVIGRVHEHDGPAITVRTPAQWDWVESCAAPLTP